ncbi:MAG: flavodoxin family protein [Acidobacteria bacterium]|nr:flavodoxin family protein [Acidobacteriota bacterium]
MKLMAINGSPRKKWNTATLLRKSLESAAAQGAKTELIHLYDLAFKEGLRPPAGSRKKGKAESGGFPGRLQTRLRIGQKTCRCGLIVRAY